LIERIICQAEEQIAALCRMRVGEGQGVGIGE
jgi:hypothetical protein